MSRLAEFQIPRLCNDGFDFQCAAGHGFFREMLTSLVQSKYYIIIGNVSEFNYSAMMLESC